MRGSYINDLVIGILQLKKALPVRIHCFIVGICLVRSPGGWGQRAGMPGSCLGEQGVGEVAGSRTSPVLMLCAGGHTRGLPNSPAFVCGSEPAPHF